MDRGQQTDIESGQDGGPLDGDSCCLWIGGFPNFWGGHSTKDEVRSLGILDPALSMELQTVSVVWSAYFLPPTLASFNKLLKTHLFHQAYQKLPT